MRAELDVLGREFMAGDARVDPKHGARTCRDCDLQGLCRISEREGEGAIAEDEVLATGITLEELRGRSFVKILKGRRGGS